MKDFEQQNKQAKLDSQAKAWKSGLTPHPKPLKDSLGQEWPEWLKCHYCEEQFSGKPSEFLCYTCQLTTCEGCPYHKDVCF